MTIEELTHRSGHRFEDITGILTRLGIPFTTSSPPKKTRRYLRDGVIEINREDVPTDRHASIYLKSGDVLGVPDHSTLGEQFSYRASYEAPQDFDLKQLAGMIVSFDNDGYMIAERTIIKIN